jgi:hypothetical protein
VALVKCPKCGAHLDLDEQYLGQEVDCGACGAAFVAEVDGPRPSRRVRDEDELPPRRSRRYDEDEEDGEDDEDDDYDRPSRRRRRRPDLEFARSLIRPPAIALMVAAVVGILWRSADLVATLFFGGMVLQQGGPPGGPGGPGGPNNQAFMIGQLASGIAVDVFSIVLSVVVIVASSRMMQLKGYGLGVTACILSMIPCTGCCLLGLPFGIWGLVMLNRPEVREGFNWTVGGTRDAE